MFLEDDFIRSSGTLKDVGTTGQIVLYCSIGAPALFFIIFLIHSMVTGLSGQELVLEMKKQIEVKGKVDAVFIDYSNHGILTVISRETKLEIPQKWHGLIEIGDSLSKYKGEIILKVFKQDTVLYLDYAR